MYFIHILIAEKRMIDENRADIQVSQIRTMDTGRISFGLGRFH
ncbi:hypothetical protein EDO6_02751 [Paenibacillus xylanexedens]|nr:hypothetical protein EDO6_02751 [Paenibacillus xylanexedens]